MKNGQAIRVERGEVEEFVNADDEQWVEIGAKTDVPLPRELTATVHQQVRHFGRLKSPDSGIFINTVKDQ